MALSDFFKMLFGQKDKTSQVSNFAPEQQQAFQQYFQNPIQNNPLYQQGSGYLQQLLSNDPEAFKNFEAPYMQNFNQNIIPGIAERFAGLGTGSGAGSSSGLYNSLGQAGTNLQTQLAGLRSGLQMQALPQALGYAQQPYSNTLQGLGARPFENVYQPGNTGLIGQVGQGLAQGFGMGVNPLQQFMRMFQGGGGVGNSQGQGRAG